jgi:hypothetical protein
MQKTQVPGSSISRYLRFENAQKSQILFLKYNLFKNAVTVVCQLKKIDPG